MPHLNVELEPEVIAVAKESAARAGMLLRAWIARAILSAGTVEANRVGTAEGPSRVMARVVANAETALAKARGEAVPR